MSSALPQDLIIMGAPGTSYWTGSVLVFNTSSGGMSVYLDDESGTVSFGSYLGKYMQGLFKLILVPFSQSVVLYTTNSIICLFCVCFMRSLTLHHRKCLSLNFLQSSGSLQRKSEAPPINIAPSSTLAPFCRVHVLLGRKISDDSHDPSA